MKRFRSPSQMKKYLLLLLLFFFFFFFNQLLGSCGSFYFYFFSGGETRAVDLNLSVSFGILDVKTLVNIIKVPAYICLGAGY